MERFFRIKEHSKLYDDYFQWVEAQENIGRIYDAFAKEWEIEASEFIPGKDRLSIIPTEKDNDKFQCEFTRTVQERGIRQFMVRSAVGKAWKQRVADIPIPDRPRYFCYGLEMLGRHSTRLLQINTELYGSITGKYGCDLPEWAEEVPGSVFYRMMEENR